MKNRLGRFALPVLLAVSVLLGCKQGLGNETDVVEEGVVAPAADGISFNLDGAKALGACRHTGAFPQAFNRVAPLPAAGSRAERAGSPL